MEIRREIGSEEVVSWKLLHEFFSSFFRGILIVRIKLQQDFQSIFIMKSRDYRTSVMHDELRQ